MAERILSLVVASWAGSVVVMEQRDEMAECAVTYVGSTLENECFHFTLLLKLADGGGRVALLDGLGDVPVDEWLETILKLSKDGRLGAFAVYTLHGVECLSNGRDGDRDMPLIVDEEEEEAQGRKADCAARSHPLDPLDQDGCDAPV